MQEAVFKAPFLGAAPVLQVSAETLIDRLNRDVLFRSRWKSAGNGTELLAHLFEDGRVLSAVRARAVYGYFPAGRTAGGLWVNDRYDWPFPILKGKRYSESFPSREERAGVLPILAVSIGGGISELSREYHLRGNFAEYFLLHGLAAELTETLAAELQRRMNRELNIQRSRRRSFGYAGFPDLSYQGDLLKLLEAERIPMTLTEFHQLIPEFSVTAMLLPPAKK